MFTEKQIEGSLNTVDRQLLYDIRNELRKLNAHYESSNSEAPQGARRGRKPKQEVS